jgi:SAM-dependent methyltransferase
MTTAIWHDVECGSYAEDLSLWDALARERGGPVLDVGAGTGRVSLHLAGTGIAVTALDLDPSLLASLTSRAAAAGLTMLVSTVVADARTFELEGQLFPLCLVPMQTVQLLGGAAGRAAFLERARRHLAPGGLLAIAISEELEPFDVDAGDPQPLPDIRELDGIVYASRPVAIRARRDGFVLARIRETVSATGAREVEQNLIVLDRLTAGELEREAIAAGLRPGGRAAIPATEDYVGSAVVMLRG